MYYSILLLLLLLLLSLLLQQIQRHATATMDTIIHFTANVHRPDYFYTAKSDIFRSTVCHFPQNNQTKVYKCVNAITAEAYILWH